MTGYILHIARCDAQPDDPDESVTLRVSTVGGTVEITDIGPARPDGHQMPPFDLKALAAALVAAQPNPPAARPRRRRHHHERVIRYAQSH
jgi:hypothetical protein